MRFVWGKRAGGEIEAGTRWLIIGHDWSCCKRAMSCSRLTSGWIKLFGANEIDLNGR